MNHTAMTYLALLHAQEAHKGQTRRNGMEPYFEHARRVAEAVSGYGCSEDAIAAAFLHDVIEDTKYTYKDLRDIGFSDQTIWYVRALTRGGQENKEAYENRIIESDDRELMIIKFCDLCDNMQLDLNYLWEGWEEAQLRYARLRMILGRRIIALGLRDD